MISDIAFKILLVAGARPNFVKIAPLFRVFASCEQYEPILIHTGQHYDAQMSGQFFVDLALPSPQHWPGASDRRPVGGGAEPPGLARLPHASRAPPGVK